MHRSTTAPSPIWTLGSRIDWLTVASLLTSTFGESTDSVTRPPVTRTPRERIESVAMPPSPRGPRTSFAGGACISLV